MTNPGAPTDTTSTVPGTPVVTPPAAAPVPAVTPPTVPAAPVVTPASFAEAPTVTQSQNTTTPTAAPGEKASESETIKLRMQIVVSLTILGAGLWVLLSKNYDEAYIKWAIGTIGIVVGYWLR